MGRPRTRTKQYFSAEEFSADRMKVWRDGWVITRRRSVPAKAPLGVGFVSLASAPLLGGLIAGAVIGLVVWLFNKTQPDEILVVDYTQDE